MDHGTSIGAEHLTSCHTGTCDTHTCGEYFVFGILCLLLGLVVSSFTGWMMARVANRNFGMVNGDILGATNEISRVPVMFFMALLMALMVVI